MRIRKNDIVIETDDAKTFKLMIKEPWFLWLKRWVQLTSVADDGKETPVVFNSLQEALDFIDFIAY